MLRQSLGRFKKNSLTAQRWSLTFVAESKRFRHCRKRIGALRQLLLPKLFDPLGNYSKREAVQTKTKGFVILAHAEIEAYLEGSARDVIHYSEMKWKTDGRAAQPLVLLLACSQKHPEPYFGKKGVLADPLAKFHKHCEKVIADHYKAISDNNGVKEQNVLKMFCPLGLAHSDLSATLLPLLDSFGSLRGVHAHDPIKSVAQIIDPETEYKAVSNLVQELKSLDTWVRTRARKSVL
jgi:hypothetical protein